MSSVYDRQYADAAPALPTLGQFVWRRLIARGHACWATIQRSLTNGLSNAWLARWYSIKSNRFDFVRPVPEADEIMARIDAQLEPKVKWI